MSKKSPITRGKKNNPAGGRKHDDQKGKRNSPVGGRKYDDQKGKRKPDGARTTGGRVETPRAPLPFKREVDPEIYIPRQNRHARFDAKLQIGDETDLKLLLPKLTKPAFFLLLDQIQDPHNFGACLRTAEGAGVDAVIFTREHTAPISPTVRAVACGAAERLRLIQATNLARTIDILKENGVWVIGTSEHADKTVYTVDFSLPTALVVGSEGDGIRRLTAERCDQVVKIPLSGRSESLNVSVSCGISLYEIVRQRLAAR